MKKNFACLPLLAMVLFLSRPASARNLPDTGGIRRMIAFTTLHSVKIEATFETLPSAAATFSVKITDDRSGRVIVDQPVTASPNPQAASPDPSAANKLIFRTGDLPVDPWTPTNPRLYRLVLTVTEPGKSPLQREQRIGFRFFESKGDSLYLNGHPLFLRGIAINPPERGIPDSIEKSRKFAEEYVKFMKSIHVNIIRIPNNETWYEVCDELGMMVFGGNYSGTVDGQKPPKEYDKAVSWYENKEFAMIARHPSLMIYAMTNETPFAGKIAAEWEKFLSYAAEKLRQWDNTRAYIANAGYGYGKAGDICDLHRYWGWYYSSPFTFLHVRNNEDIVPFTKKSQPITFTECVGNYSGPDGRYNLTPDHKNPGSQLNWTGHAPDNIQASLADEHQSFTFKQATELMRRLRSVNPELSGVFPFTILFYNWHTIHDFVDMGPKPVTQQARLSYSPVLVSWENWTTQLYAGATLKPVIHIVNDADDFSNLAGATFVYQLLDQTMTALLSDSIQLPDIAYYSTFDRPLTITLPNDLGIGHYQLTGKVIKNGITISENADHLFIADKVYTESADKPQRKVWLYTPGSPAASVITAGPAASVITASALPAATRNSTRNALRKLSIPFREITTLKNISPADLLIIGENSADANLSQQAAALKQFVASGGRLLCLRQDSACLSRLNAVIHYPVKNVVMDLDISAYPPPPRPSRNGYYINPERPDHPVFDGIDREELKVWSDYTGWKESDKKGFPAIYPVTDGFVPVDKKDMEHISVLGDYGPGLEGMAMAEMFSGTGSLLLCGMDLANRSGLDPVADRLLSNLVGYMGNDRLHDPYVLVTGPITWGDYGSEKGLLTGINSGLLLNSKPRLTGAYSKEGINIDRAGNEFAAQKSGFNTRPGVQYVAYGRRPYGPYAFRGFGDVPEPLNAKDSIGTGSFYCSLPKGRTSAATLIWNPTSTPLSIKVSINAQSATRQLAPGERATVDCPVTGTRIKMTCTGDRRLVLLQTTFISSTPKQSATRY
jgi:beta-galactosidase